MKNFGFVTAALVLAGAVSLPGTASANREPPLHLVSWPSNSTLSQDSLASSGYVPGKGEELTGAASTTPEPLSMALLATGLVALMLVPRRRKKQLPA